MKTKKWFIANNKFQKNKDIVNIIPFIKVWYSKQYFLETGVFTPAFGIASSWLKWNYYFTLQQTYSQKLDPDFMYKWIKEKSGK